MDCALIIDGQHQQVSAPSVDRVSLHERAASFTKRSLKKAAKLQGLKLVIAMMDLTTLEGKDTRGKIAYLCHKAKHPMAERYDVPSCGAVCIYPNFVAEVARHLDGAEIEVASVATAFPSGQMPLEMKLAEVKQAVTDGATEIDMVINRGAFLMGKYQIVADEIAATREACGDAHLKVILETGELETYDNIRFASEIAMRSGAHFIKTSTGKISPAATMPTTLVMLEAIRDYHAATGKVTGMKPAGGIRYAKESLHYLVMIKETLGDDWLTPHRFRFGASSLLTDVSFQIAKYIDGPYQSANYHSIA